MSLIGQKIMNYRIDSKIGEGGMGSVYLATHELLHTRAAIKVLHPSLGANSTLRSRFLTEAAILSGLNHPNIVRVLDFHEDEKGLYIIMEYVEGISLDELIRTKTGPIPEEKAFKIFEKILDGFQYAHSRRPAIIHRDIKPSNIIVGEENNPKIIDFGIVKIVDDSGAGVSGHTVAGTKIGTTLYMSPEQILAKEVDARSDIFSLGITLFVMLTGRSPFGNTNSDFEIQNLIVNNPLPRAKDIYPGVSDKAQRIIDKATEKRKENRYQNCREFIAALHEPDIAPVEVEPAPVLDSPTVFDSGSTLDAATTFEPVATAPTPKSPAEAPSKPKPQTEPFKKEKTKSKAPILVVAFLLIAAAGFAGWFFLIRDNKPTNPIVANTDSLKKDSNNIEQTTDTIKNILPADSIKTNEKKMDTVMTVKPKEIPKPVVEEKKLPKEEKKEEKKVPPKTVSKPIDQQLVIKGGRLAQQRCSSCHNILSAGYNIGPGWVGLTKKRSESWLLHYMTTPKDMSNINVDNVKSTCLVQIPRRSLDYDEAKNVIEFMRNNDK